MGEKVLQIKRIITIFLVIFVLFISMIIIAAVIEVNREQVHSEVMTFDQPIRISAMTFAELNRVIQSQYPQYCDGMIFVDATAKLRFRGNTILQAEASLVYDRYIDESMEGGNVETYICRFDLTANTFVAVEHVFGSGRSISVSDNVLSDNMIKTPFDQYIYHANEVIDLQSDQEYRMEADCTESWMKLALRSVRDGALLYRETLTQWPESDHFSERTFELIDD